MQAAQAQAAPVHDQNSMHKLKKVTATKEKGLLTDEEFQKM
jgi:hypothetical protein